MKLTLEDRLRSRFEWGLIADIQPPDKEMRLAILQSKAALQDAGLPPEVLEVIASRYHNIRELEGVLNRVLAIASLGSGPITVAAAELALAEMGPSRPLGTPQAPDAVIAAVPRHYSLQPVDLSGITRHPEWPSFMKTAARSTPTALSPARSGGEILTLDSLQKRHGIISILPHRDRGYTKDHDHRHYDEATAEERKVRNALIRLHQYLEPKLIASPDPEELAQEMLASLEGALDLSRAARILSKRGVAARLTQDRRIREKECVVCGAAFSAIRSDATYCSHRCNMAASRRRAAGIHYDELPKSTRTAS